MKAHRTQAVVEAGGKLLLEELPFREGDVVEVLVTTRRAEAKPENAYPLRGTAYQYREPFEPAVPPEEWEALR